MTPTNRRKLRTLGEELRALPQPVAMSRRKMRPEEKWLWLGHPLLPSPGEQRRARGEFP